MHGSLSLGPICFDSDDPPAGGRFWAELLGCELEVDEDGDAVVHLDDPLPPLLFLKVPEGKAVKNRLHLDIDVDPGDLDAEIDRAIELGATEPDGVLAGPFRWKVLLDPQGNEFCLIPRRPPE